MLCIRTERLLLRPFGDDDRAPFAAMNADPRVMEHFPGVLTRPESDALVDRIRAHWERHGFGLFAVERPGGDDGFLGFVGLMLPSFETPFGPCVEIGWRLAPHAWGHGYATEGARACLRFGWKALDLDAIVSFTVLANRRSWSVMERLGMKRDLGADFDHPRVPEGHPVRRHILYRIARPG